MAKFCGICGAKMDDGVKVCGMCGTPFANVPNANPQPSFQASVQSNNVDEIPGVTKPEGNIKVVCLCDALLFFMLGILNFTGILQVGALGLTKTFTLIEIFENGLEFVPIIMGLLIFAAAVMSIIPIFGAAKRRRFIFQKVVSFLAFAFMIFVYISVVLDGSSSLYDFTFTLSGWIYLFICITNIVLSVLISKRSK